MEENNKKALFNYINPEDNNQISSMNKEDLKELLYYINNYYLELRQNLEIENYITFGLEIELEYTKENIIKEIMKEINISKDWIVKDDNSLTSGVEITSPILTDEVKNWCDLQKICNTINKHAKIGPHCGGHIHIGSQIINSSPEVLIKFIKLWSAYENIIYRFLYGEYLTARPNIIKYAKPISKFVWNNYENICQMQNSAFSIMIKEIYFQRNEAINFNNFNLVTDKPKNTIEFRNPNGSLNPIIWQNNVNLLVKMFLYANKLSYNDNLISKRQESSEYYYSLDSYNDYNNLLDYYNQIYLNEALEFCDMIFENNLDKIYFLRQYLKSFETGKNALTKAKVFTR